MIFHLAYTTQEPIKDPARFNWYEVSEVAHYWLEVNAVTRPMQVQEGGTLDVKGTVRE